MIPLTLRDVAAVVGGHLVDDADPSPVVLGVCADSRVAQPGDLFIAIPGERTDGHDHAAAAYAAGAIGLLGSRAVAGPCIVVADPVEALGRLAAHARSVLSSLTVVGITGSSGKTTTKDLLAQIIPALGATIAPEGSFNTEVGLPLTMLRADEQTRYLVLEMGMRGFGHIRYLCDIARPDVALILNVGSAHQEMLGGVDGIAQAKGELVDSLTGSGLAILNADDPRVLAMTRRSAAPVTTFGLSPGSHVRGTDVRLDAQACPAFTLHHHDEAVPVALRFPGAHMVSNALGAAAVALSLGMPIAEVGDLLGSATMRSRWRMEVSTSPRGLVVINDTYNANPESVTAALHALKAMEGTGRRWAVLGEMRELGDDADMLHAQIGRLTGSLDLDRVIVVGERARPIATALAGSAVHCEQVPDAAAALNLVRAGAGAGDVILIKASRAVGLESVAAAILSDGLSAAEGSRA